MKRYIRSTIDLDRMFVPPYDEDGTKISVADAIDAMTYSTYDNYHNDPDATYDLILEVIIEHLEAPDLYDLKEGIDFSWKDVVREMYRYDWGYINENMSIGRWMVSKERR